jgi:protein-glutamine gamma-glutamyltransferase
VKVEEGLGLVTYRTRAAPGRSLGGPPTDLDLKLPAQEGPVVTRIARELGLADRPPAQAVATVSRYFASGFAYSTYLDAPRRRTGALEDFLLRTRAGHCEYFATGTVLLLRAAGIPARYATGYSVQEWSPREQRYLVRRRHGHSWALVYLDAVWHDVDTTPSVWARVEQEAASSSWQPLADLASWAWFLFSRWRFSDQDPGDLRHAGWLLVPLFGFLAWRLYGKRRVARAAAIRPDAAPSASHPGADSEFYLVEARLARLGLGRQPWEPVPRWVARVGADGLAELAALHARFRFDPRGLSAIEREALRAAAGAWLARGPEVSAMPDPARRPGSPE